MSGFVGGKNLHLDEVLSGLITENLKAAQICQLADLLFAH